LPPMATAWSAPTTAHRRTGRPMHARRFTCVARYTVPVRRRWPPIYERRTQACRGCPGCRPWRQRWPPPSVRASFVRRISGLVIASRYATGGRPPPLPPGATAWSAPTSDDRVGVPVGASNHAREPVSVHGAHHPPMGRRRGAPGRCPRGQRRWAPPSVRACFRSRDSKVASETRGTTGGRPPLPPRAAAWAAPTTEGRSHA